MENVYGSCTDKHPHILFIYTDDGDKCPLCRMAEILNKADKIIVGQERALKASEAKVMIMAKSYNSDNS